MRTSTSVLASTASVGSWDWVAPLSEEGSRLEREEAKLEDCSSSPLRELSSSFRANLIVHRLLAIEGSREARSSSLKKFSFDSLVVPLYFLPEEGPFLVGLSQSDLVSQEEQEIFLQTLLIESGSEKRPAPPRVRRQRGELHEPQVKAEYLI